MSQNISQNIRERTSSDLRAIIDHDPSFSPTEREVLETACQILDHAGSLERLRLRTLTTMQTPIMDPVFPAGRAGS